MLVMASSHQDPVVNVRALQTRPRRGELPGEDPGVGPLRQQLSAGELLGGESSRDEEGLRPRLRLTKIRGSHLAAVLTGELGAGVVIPAGLEGRKVGLMSGLRVDRDDRRGSGLVASSDDHRVCQTDGAGLAVNTQGQCQSDDWRALTRCCGGEGTRTLSSRPTGGSPWWWRCSCSPAASLPRARTSCSGRTGSGEGERRRSRHQDQCPVIYSPERDPRRPWSGPWCGPLCTDPAWRAADSDDRRLGGRPPQCCSCRPRQT